MKRFHLAPPTALVSGLLTVAGLLTLTGCGGSSLGFTDPVDGSTSDGTGDSGGTTDGTSGDGSPDGAGGDGTVGDGSGGDGGGGDGAGGDGAVDAPPDVPACEAPKKLCGGLCLDVSADPANCGDCGKVCAAPNVCAAGTCSPPKCKSAAPTVLFYGAWSMEKAYLPAGATSTLADDTAWRALKTADFAKYDLIIVGAPDLAVSSSSTPSSSMLLALFETRAEWGPAITGRVAVFGIDPGYHAVKGNAGATVFQKASLIWLTTGAPRTTALYVNSDWGNRNLDFLSPLGTFGSKGTSTDAITMVAGTHPMMTGSTSSSLSSWGTSAHSFITVPSTYTTLATGTVGGGDAGTSGIVAAAKDGPPCVP